MVEHAHTDLLHGIDVSDILNYQKIDDYLHTSGQPSIDEFELICQAGVNTVINLALTNASNSLMHDHIHEDSIILNLGMNYVQLPLLWERPCPVQALLVIKFIRYLVEQQGQTVWVHCAKNWRVSGLMYLYRQFYMQMPIDEAQALLHEIWQPDETWTGLMYAVEMQLRAEQIVV